jgi:predicted nucleic acid-binding Zn ribbon protein
MSRREQGSRDPGSAGQDPSPLAEVLDLLRARPGWAAQLEAARIHQYWAEIAGDQLVRHAEPVRLAGGVLVVRASSSAWAEQVRYLSSGLAQRANEVLGLGNVRQVTVITGALQNRL